MEMHDIHTNFVTNGEFIDNSDTNNHDLNYGDIHNFAKSDTGASPFKLPSCGIRVFQPAAGWQLVVAALGYAVCGCSPSIHVGATSHKPAAEQHHAGPWRNGELLPDPPEGFGGELQLCMGHLAAAAGGWSVHRHHRRDPSVGSMQMGAPGQPDPGRCRYGIDLVPILALLQ